MRRLAAASAVLLLGGCATQRVVQPREALSGRPLETAVSLYGRYQERAVIDGRSFYVWRKTVEVEGRPYGCELRVELGYRSIIRETVLEGFPAACAAFAVRYTSDPNVARKNTDEPDRQPPSA